MCYLVIHESGSLKRKKFRLEDGEIKQFIKARSILLATIEMEEIYDQIIESFWDYNNKVNYWSMRSIQRRIGHYDFDYEITSSLNRLSFNVLNLGKLFLDKHYHEEDGNCFSFEITKMISSEEKIISHREEVYENNIQYVIACKLRDKSQHRILPVHGFYSQLNNQKVKEKIQVLFKIPYDYEKLIDIGVPKKFLDKESSYDLTEIISGYVFAISKMQELNRKLTSNKIENSKKMSFIIYCDNRKIYNANLEWTKQIDYLHSKHPFPIDYSNMFYDEL